MNQEFEKIHKRYNNIDKKCNSLLLDLDNFYEFVEDKEEESEQEQYLLQCMEREINDLKYSIECYKNEIDKIHYNKINEEIKKEL